MIGDYFLSNGRIFTCLVLQRAAGDATVASIAPNTFGTVGSASTTEKQVPVRLALRHKF